MMKQQYGKLLLLGAASLVLTACGGGGGGSSTTTVSDVGYSGSTTGVTISDQASADAVVSSTITSAINMDLTGDIPLSYKSGSSTGTVPGLASFTQQMIDRALALPASTTLAGVTDTQPCNNGGSIAYSSSFDPNTTQPSSGDWINMTANSCDDGYGYILNGSFSMNVLSYSSTGMSVTANFSHMTTTYSGTGDYTMLNGGFTMALTVNSNTSVTSYSITGDALMVEESSGGVVSQQALSQFSLVDTIDASYNFTADHDYTFYSTELSGGVTVTTVTPIYIYSSDYYPSSGVVVITCANGASVRVTAIDNTLVQIDYDLDADGVYGDTDPDDPASQTKYWYEL